MRRLGILTASAIMLSSVTAYAQTRIVSAVGTLRANTVPSPQLCVLGYYGAGTAGGGCLALIATGVSSSLDNSCTIFVDASGDEYQRQGNQQSVSVTDCGATGNTKVVASSSVSIASGSNNLTVAGASFKNSDVGKSIEVSGAGAAGIYHTLVSTISAYVGATQVRLADNASNTVTEAAETVIYGTDDTTAWTNARNAISNLASSTYDQAISAPGGTISCPAGIYLLSATIYGDSNVHIVGADAGQFNQYQAGNVPSALSSVNLQGACSVVDNNPATNSIPIDFAGFWIKASNGTSGTAQAGAAKTITLALTASGTDHFYEGSIIRITGGTGAGEQNQITNYAGASKLATVAYEWDKAPDSSSAYSVDAHAAGSRFTTTEGAASGGIGCQNGNTVSVESGVGMSNINIVTMLGQYAGFRVVCTTQGTAFSNILTFGFQVGYERNAVSYGKFSQVTTLALYEGRIEFSGDHASCDHCASWGTLRQAVPAVGRPWLVGVMASATANTLDPNPSWSTGYYGYYNAASTDDNADGENYDRSYFRAADYGGVCNGCHMEVWQHQGFYGTNGSLVWNGGDSFASVTGAAFQGATFTLTIVNHSVDPNEVGTFALIGTFNCTYGGHVTILDTPPDTGDRDPTGTGCVSWDYYNGKSVAWTPVLRGSGSAGSVTYTARTGSYSANNNIVTATFYLAWSAFSGASGDALITGLPISPITTRGTFWEGACRSDNVTFPSGTSMITASLNDKNGATIIPIATGSGVATTEIPISDFPARGGLTCTIAYARY
jgi:hypothetical protein